ncbi:MAG TPA: TlpA disulfide reductase family protein [Bacteroidales bacterium]|nr:TlpA disulfide reductase family protein [Bacteroidales bacterium]
MNLLFTNKMQAAIKKKHSIVISILLINLWGLSCFSQSGYKIIGDLSGFKDSSMIYLFDKDNDVKIDSASIVNNKFELKGNVESAVKCRIAVKHPTKPKWLKNDFWLENSVIHFKADINNFGDGEVVGSAMQDQENGLNKWSTELESRRTEVVEKIVKTESSNKSQYDSLLNVNRDIEFKIAQSKKQFVSEHLDREYSSYVLYSLVKHFSISKKDCQLLYEKLSGKVRASKYGLLLQNYLALCTNFRIGDRFKEFTLSTIEGLSVTISSKKGVYILLHFWESSCSHSREENKTLLHINNLYKTEGLEIVAVCLDSHKDTWQQTIKSDGINWLTVSDLKGYDGSVAMIYRIDYVPQNFLIDPNGIIIDKDLHGDKLIERLGEIYKN